MGCVFLFRGPILRFAAPRRAPPPPRHHTTKEGGRNTMEETTCRFSHSSSSSCSLLQLSHEEENCFKSALAFVVLRRRLLQSTKRPAPNESCPATDIAIDTTGTVVHVDVDTTNNNNTLPKRTEDNKHGGSCSLFSGILPSLTSPSKWPPVVPLQQQHHPRHRQRQQQHYHHLEDMMRVAITTAMSLYKDDDDDMEDNNDYDDHTNHHRRVVRHGWIYDYKQAATIPTTNHHSNPPSVYGTMNGLVLHLALQLRSMLVQQDTHHTNDTNNTNNSTTTTTGNKDRGTARNDPTEMCQWLLTWMKRTLVPWASPDNHANHPDNVTNNNNNHHHHPDNDETEERTETSTSSSHSSNSSENHPSPHHQQNHHQPQRQCNTERQTTTRTRTAKQLLATCTVWHRIAIVACQPHNPPTGTTNSSNSNSTNHTVTGMLLETIGSILRDLHEDKLDCSLLNSSSRGTSESCGGGWSLSDVLAVNLIHLLEGMIPALLRIGGHAPQWRRQIIQTTYPSSNTYEKEPSLSLLLPNNEQQQDAAWAVQQQLQQALDPLWLPIPITEQAHVYYSNQHRNRNRNRNRNLRHPHQHPHQHHNHHHNQYNQHHERCCYLTGGAKLMLRMALYDIVQKLSLLSSSSTPPLLHTYPTKTTVSPRSTTTTAPYSISTNTEHAGIVTGEY